jgi:hypothetical protein
MTTRGNIIYTTKSNISHEMRHDNASIALYRKIVESVYCYRIPQTSCVG